MNSLNAAQRSEILAVLDRSGSMSDCVPQTIDGFNRFVRLQKEDRPLDTRITTVLFDDRYELLHRAIPLLDVAPLTDREYFPRGCTALFDAVGRTLTEARARIADTPAGLRPQRVVVLVVTDGLENASREFSGEHVRTLVELCRKDGWEFFFLGAELESFDDANRIGVGAQRQASFDKADASVAFCRMSATVKDYLAEGSVDARWQENLKRAKGKGKGRSA